MSVNFKCGSDILKKPVLTKPKVYCTLEFSATDHNFSFKVMLKFTFPAAAAATS